MKRRFTILTAALALLTFLAVPMGMRGQTKATVTDNMTASALAATGTSYTAFSNVSLTSDAVYAGKSALNNNANIQLRSSGSDCGIVTTVSGGKIKSITINVASGSNTIDVYGKNTAYTGAAQLYNATNQGTKLGSVSSTGTITVSGDYEYVGVRSYNGAVYISSISFVWETASSTATATTVTIDDSGITNTDVYVNTAAGSLSATVTENVNNTTISGATVTWSSSDTNVATVGENGAITLVAAGTTTITASYGGQSGVYGSSSATYELTVTNSEPYVQPTTIEIIPNYTFWGKTGQFSGNTYDELDGSQDNVSLHWTRGNGSTYANLSAMRFYKDNDLTFNAPEGYEIISIKLSVTGTYNDLTFDPTGFDNETTTWTGAAETVTMSRPSNADSYAQISKFIITLAAQGSAVATTTTINVPANFNTDIYQGTTAGTLTATVSAEGTPISGATVTWSSSNTGVATIDANGEVTLVAVGTTTITASYAGVEDQYRPSEGTYELTVTDSNAPGTQNNPYTVAQARAAIDAGTGTQGVYATGIVSSIETAWNTQYSNITFNFVDNAGDTDFLQAFRCVSGTGVDASTVAVGDIVVVHGNLTKYGSTYEFGQGCELVSLEHPTTPFVTVTPSTINAPFAGAEGTLALTYENIEEFISFDYYFCDANGNELEETDPDYPGDWIYAEINDENEAYTLSYIIDANDGEARTAYMKVYTFDDNLEEVYAIVTINQAQYVIDYATLPFEWEGGASADLLALNGVTAQGLGSDYGSNNAPYLIKFDGTGDYIQVKTNEQPGKVTIGVKMIGGASTSTITIQGSADGETFTDVEELTISGAQNDVLTLETTNAFAANVRYVRMLFTKGSNVGVGPITIAVVSNESSITVNPDEVNVDAEEHDGTLDLTYENLTITDMNDFDIQFCDANGDELSEEPDWIEVLVAEQDPEIGEGYVVSYYMVENEGPDARTAYFKVYAMDDETNLVYSNLVTISQAAPVAPATGDEYALYTGELVEGDYLIVYDGGAMNTTVESDRLQYEDVTVNNDVIVTDNAAIVWHIAPSGQYWTIYNADANAYAASTGAKNKAQMLADGTDDKALWTVSGTETYEFVNKKNTANNVNANLRKNGTYGFACYATSTGGALSLYKKVGVEPATETYTLKIAGYGTNAGGYYLIASPVAIDPTTVEDPESHENMILTGNDAVNYDLYAFDESEEDEWRNYKTQAFNLQPGKGYLYAHKRGGNFAIVGVPYSGDGKVTLQMTEGNYWEGWNLIGNPWGTAATIETEEGQEVSFYVMGDDGMSFIVGNNNVDPLQGIFVIATSGEQEVTFVPASTPAPGEGKLIVNLTASRSSVIDRAIVRFGQGTELPKFMFNPNSTKIYIPQSGEDYAVVRSAGEAEMPVNFKAAQNGTYTLSINPANVEMEYLHLIDNMTGTDIDLLETPSYTFEASTTDAANRFSLMYGVETGVSENTVATFAYFNGSQWVVNNSGEATLQVVDALGRVVSTKTINGNAEVSIDQTAGVYMIRLINGNNVKTQKVVVK